MSKKPLVVGKADFGDTVSSMFGILDCETQVKSSRVATTTRQKTDYLARISREETKRETAMRESREKREKLIWAANAQAVIDQANTKPEKCRKLIRHARRFLPETHKIVLEASPFGILRKLVSKGQPQITAA